jgi:hypothetical protein
MLVFYQHYKIICTIMFLLFFYSTLVHTVDQNILNEYVTIFYTFLHNILLSSLNYILYTLILVNKVPFKF